jgi:hypothetical protein
MKVQPDPTALSRSLMGTEAVAYSLQPTTQAS